MAAVAAISLLTGCTRELDVTIFNDVTDKSGLGNYVGMTHGAAWGDYDNDGQPDLYVTNHLRQAMLFRNLGGGRFADVTAEVFNSKDLGGDKHGAAWADFNNDGQLDLVQLTGAIQGVGVEPKRLFVNEGGKLVERAVELGVDNPPGRTRMPLWLDIDHDGKLDLFQGAEARFDDLTPPFLFAQQDGRFADATALLQPDSRSAPFCVLTALNDDRYPEVVCRLMGQGRPVQVFDTSASPARTLDLLPNSAFEDVAAGDFDNDGRIDLFMARKNSGGRVALARGGENELTAQIELTPKNVAEPTAFRFRSRGTLSLTVAGQHDGELEPTDVKLGPAGTSPASLVFDLATDAMRGLPQPPGGARPAVLVGSHKPGQWQIEFHARPEVFGGKAKPRYINVRIHSTEAIEDVEALGDGAKDETAPARLFMNREGKLVEEGDKRGVNEISISAVNAVAGDFDNDMDLDIFVLGSGDAGKTPNLLLLNNGKGKFEVVRNAGGAAGRLVGVGDSVTTADIDGDGFLDILTTSGGSMGRSLGLPSDNGRYQLFRNVGNGNHWIMIDLEGTTTNRDGIGAVVRVTAGGVTQMRVQDGGIHERGQNHARLHFGLAKHTQVDKITVQWPSGVVQELQGVKPDQVLKIKEPGA
ncbi:MAG: CRTAC1 family protein [Thiobacillus sp.]|nr:CRTAC1 family protein [Thiobacillus sp.]MDP2978882.1 CRTAC1 family protein [Thiobacillus sp.]